MYYDQIKLLKQGVEKARGLLGDAIDVVPGLGTVNQGLLAAENIGRGNLAGAAENIQNLVPTGKIAGRAIKALTKGKGQSELSGLLSAKAPRQDALDLAQKRAALPVSEGGLGLPPDNTPMDRAKAMGFDIDSPLYHGTGADIQAFDPSQLGTNTRAAGDEIGVFTSGKPDLASQYAEIAARGGWYGRRQPGQANVIPLVSRAQNPKQYETASGFYRDADAAAAQRALGEMRNGLQSQGYDSIQVRPDREEVVMFDPSMLRSRFAAFDPFRRNESDLLAIQGGLLGTSQDSSILNRYETDADRRMEIARRNAALPVDQGGLGLPENNTPMDRARAMGYVIPGYHGTGQDVPYFDLSRQVNGDRSGAGVYTGSASKASGYAVGESPNVMPLLMRGKVMRANDEPLSNDSAVKLSDYVNNTMSEGDRARFALDAGSGRKTQYFDTPQDASDFFESQRKNWEYFGGYDRTFPEVVQDGDRFGVSYTPFGSGVDLSGTTKRQVVDALRSSGSGNIAPALRGAGYDILDTGGEKVTFDPTMVRSRFAAFDPFRRNESDLLALQGGQYTPQDLLGFERMMGLLGE